MMEKKEFIKSYTYIKLIVQNVTIEIIEIF